MAVVGRGTLLRAHLAYQGAHRPDSVMPPGRIAVGADSKAAHGTPFAAATGTARSNTEPTAQEATIKAAHLFRPGSPISIGRCGSPKGQSPGSDRVAAAAAQAGTSGGTLLHVCSASLPTNLNAQLQLTYRLQTSIERGRSFTAHSLLS
jgi:hypothetical protein